eukprot:scaffold282646_cov40-Tisochrysis_lutea.AAC.1
MRVVAALLQLAALAAGSNEYGVKFLEENAQKSGVIALPSGLQYKVLRAGEGTEHPTADSPCECHYEGRTAQKFAEDPTSPSNTFDGSYARGSPTTFAPNQVIKGWTEGRTHGLANDELSSSAVAPCQSNWPTYQDSLRVPQPCSLWWRAINGSCISPANWPTATVDLRRRLVVEMC